MSIVNAFVMPDFALICADTEAMMPDGTTPDACKMLFLPHLSAVVAFRGQVLTLQSAASLILGFGGDFDELIGQMSLIVSESLRISADIRSKFSMQIEEHDAEYAQFVLVGYSHKSGRMVGHAFVQNSAETGIEEHHDRPFFLSPHWNDSALSDLGIEADRAGMIKLSIEQCRLIRERAPDASGGGHLIIVEVRKGGIYANQEFCFPHRNDRGARLTP